MLPSCSPRFQSLSLLLIFSPELEVLQGRDTQLFKSLLYPQHRALCLAHSKGLLPEHLHKWFLYTGSKLNYLNNSSDDIILLALGARHCLEIKPLLFNMSFKVLSDLLPDLIFKRFFCYLPASINLS